MSARRLIAGVNASKCKCRARALSTAVAVSALAMLASPVSANARRHHNGERLRVVSRSTVVPPTPLATSVVATCPKGQSVVAGGFAAPEPSTKPPAHWLSIFESRRVGRRSWRVSAVQSFPGATSESLVSYAACEAINARIKVRAATTTLATGTGAVTATHGRCEHGTSAIAGGFSTNAGAFGAIDSIWADYLLGRRSWAASATRISGPTGTLTAYAYCLAHVRIRQTSVTSTPGSRPKVLIQCHSGLPRGGGFRSSPASSNLLTAPLIYELRLAKRMSWTAAIAGGGSAQVTAFTYCS